MKVFLDTMIWLHYQPIEDVDIRQIVPGGDLISIIVPRITLKEIDKHKNHHKNSKIRDRARKVLKLIEEVSVSPGFRTKNGIQVELYQRLPGVDFEKLGLSKESADEVLIATVLTYQGEHPNEVIRLYTEDTTPRITAKPLGVEALAFPENLKLEPELDLVEKENRELKNEIARLKSVRPSLDCGFLVSGQRLNTLSVNLSQPLGLSVDRIAEKLLELEAIYPKKYPSAHPGLVSDKLAIFSAVTGGSILDAEFTRYNQEVDEYLKEFEEYLMSSHNYQAQKHLNQSVDIEIGNVGNAPAEDVDVWLHFPDGCLLYEDLPPPPEEPCPPIEPRSLKEIMTRSLNHGYQPKSPMIDFSSSSLSNFSLRKTNSYEVTDHFKRIKHGHQAPMKTLVMTFPSFEAAVSFQVEYRVTAANIPTALTGMLNVKVTK